MDTLICNVCSEEKSLENFWKNKNNVTGYDTRCKQCKKVLRDAYRKKLKEHNLLNPPSATHLQCTKCKELRPIKLFKKELSRKFGVITVCKDCRKLYWKKPKSYGPVSKERSAEYCRKYRENNLEKVKEIYRRYYQKNKDRINERNKERLKEKREQNPNQTSPDTIKVKRVPAPKASKPVKGSSANPLAIDETISFNRHPAKKAISDKLLLLIDKITQRGKVIETDFSTIEQLYIEYKGDIAKLGGLPPELRIVKMYAFLKKLSSSV